MIKMLILTLHLKQVDYSLFFNFSGSIFGELDLLLPDNDGGKTRKFSAKVFEETKVFTLESKVIMIIHKENSRTCLKR